MLKRSLTVTITCNWAEEAAILGCYSHGPQLFQSLGIQQWVKPRTAGMFYLLGSFVRSSILLQSSVLLIKYVFWPLRTQKSEKKTKGNHKDRFWTLRIRAKQMNEVSKAAESPHLNLIGTILNLRNLSRSFQKYFLLHKKLFLGTVLFSLSIHTTEIYICIAVDTFLIPETSIQSEKLSSEFLRS